MEFSKNVMDIFDNLAANFGIVLDWSQENILPYLSDIFSKWRVYTITINGLGILVSMVLLFITFFLTIKIFKDYKKYTKKYSFFKRVYRI